MSDVTAETAGSEPATTGAPAAAELQSPTAQSAIADSSKRKSERESLTFVLPNGSRHKIFADEVKSVPDGLLCRMNESELTARNADGSIPISQECDSVAFALAVAEHKWQHKHRMKVVREEYGPPLTMAIHPQVLARVWDYFQLPQKLLEPSRKRTGTPLRVMVDQATMHQSLLLAQHLSNFLRALHVCAGDSIMRTRIIHPLLGENGAASPARALLWIYLGRCHSITQGTPSWDYEDRCKGRIPQTLGVFPIEIFDLLGDKQRLQPFVQAYLPGRAEEISQISLRESTEADLPSLQRPWEVTVEAAIQTDEDVAGLCGRVAGSFAVAVSFLPLLVDRYRQNAKAKYEIDGWCIEIDIVSDEVDEDEMVEKPADLQLPKPWSDANKLVEYRYIEVYATVSPSENARYTSELKPVGLCVEVFEPPTADEEKEHRQWLRETFFKDGSRELGDRCFLPGCDTKHWSIAQSRMLRREEYLTCAGINGNCAGYAPRCFVTRDASVAPAACCPGGMRTPYQLSSDGPCYVMHPKHVPGAALAMQSGSVLADASSYFTFHFEAWHLRSNAGPSLEKYCFPDHPSECDNYQGKGVTADGVCKFAVIEISGSGPTVLGGE
jgi:hypothetical protein